MCKYYIPISLLEAEYLAVVLSSIEKKVYFRDESLYFIIILIINLNLQSACWADKKSTF